MPVVQITTTLCSEKLPKDFDIKFSKFLATVLEKDIQKITLVINCSARICDGGDTCHYMHMYIHSIARFNVESNPGFTEQIVDYVNKTTNIPRNKVKITYTDLPPLMTGKGK